jgi:hypothetical protein
VKHVSVPRRTRTQQENAVLMNIYRRIYKPAKRSAALNRCAQITWERPRA